MSAGVDLSGLDDFNAADFLAETDLDAATSGHPLLVPLEQIIPDPNQPRQELDERRLKELADSIRARGVKSPISLKPKNEDGFYLINHGERRWRASQKAGLTEIPAFIDDDHNSYDQVIENIQRENLSPLEIAHFIERCQEGGDKKGQIAKMLGKPASYVSDHALFFKFPEAVRDLYDSGRCRAIQALAMLHRAYKDFPDQVADFCSGERDIAKPEVERFVAELKKPKDEPLEEKIETPGEDMTGAMGEPSTQEPAEVEFQEEEATVSGPGGNSVVEPRPDHQRSDSEETDLEATLYEQLERLLDPLESYLKEVSDPEFRAAAVNRLQEIAGKFSK